MWFDSHCHLDFAAFDADRAAVWQRARALGVERVFVPGVTREQWPGLVALQRALPGVHLGVGLHPYFLHRTGSEAVETALAELPDESIRLGARAIGECGVDGRPARVAATPLERQLSIFERHLSVARELGLPPVMHVVRAHGAALALLERFGPFAEGGVLHSYSGAAELVPRYARLGLSFGFSAAACRSDTRKVGEAVRAVPLERLLIETDAPDQPPPALRALDTSRNEPSALLDVAAAVAAHRGLSLERLAEVTTSNAERLFAARPMR